MSLNFKKKLNITLLFLAMLIIPLSSAISIDNNTIVKSDGLNLTFNFTSAKYLDTLVVDSNYISFIGLRNSELDNETLSFNVTENNSSYFSSSLPYISSSTATAKTITSTLSQTINATVVVNVDPIKTCIIKEIRYTSETGAFNRVYTPGDWTCNSTSLQLTMTLNGIENSNDGGNQMSIVYLNVIQGSGICPSIFTSFSSFFGNISSIFIILGALMILGVIGMVIGISQGYISLPSLSGDIDLEGIDYKTIFTSIVLIFGIALIAIAGIISVNAICGANV